MGLFKSLKEITVAGGKTLASSVELLAEVAGEAERASHHMLLRATARRLEQELEGPGRPDGPSRLEKSSELLGVYDALIVIAGNSSERAPLVEKREVLLKEQRRRDAQALLAKVDSLERFADRKWSLPINEIKAWRPVATKLNGAIVLLKENGEATQLGPLQVREREISLKLAKLELLRSTKEEIHHLNGVLESRISLRDGERQGLSETWYASGQRRSAMMFSEGVLRGGFSYFRENGSVIVEGVSTGAGLSVRAYLPDGTLALDAKLQSDERCCHVWLQDKLSLGRFSWKRGGPGKLRLLLQAVIRPACWRLLLRDRKMPQEETAVGKLLEVMRHVELFADEVCAAQT